MRVKDLINELQKLDQDEEVLMAEYCGGDVSYRKVDYIEQWSTEPDCSHHYTIYPGDLVSG